MSDVREEIHGALAEAGYLALGAAILALQRARAAARRCARPTRARAARPHDRLQPDSPGR